MNNKQIAKEILQELKDNDAFIGEIGDRGGNLRVSTERLLNIVIGKVGLSYEDEEYIRYKMPKSFGAYCNYLGGGIRGSICKSNFDKCLWKEYPKVAGVLDAIGNLFIKYYKEIESEDIEPDYWNDKATKPARKKGIESAY